MRAAVRSRILAGGVAFVIAVTGCAAPRDVAVAARTTVADRANGALVAQVNRGASVAVDRDAYATLPAATLYNSGDAPVVIDRVTPDATDGAIAPRVMVLPLSRGGDIGASRTALPVACTSCVGSTGDWPPSGADGPLTTVAATEPATLDPAAGTQGTPALAVYAGLRVDPAVECAAFDGFFVDYHTGAGDDRTSYREWFPVAYTACRDDVSASTLRVVTAATDARVDEEAVARNASVVDVSS